jgi:hypothetical protein
VLKTRSCACLPPGWTHNVTLGVGEDTRLGASALPLLAVLGNDLTKLGRVLQDGTVLGIRVDVALVNSGTEVLKARGNGQAVKLGRSDAGAEENGDDCLGEHDVLLRDAMRYWVYQTLVDLPPQPAGGVGCGPIYFGNWATVSTLESCIREPG